MNMQVPIKRLVSIREACAITSLSRTTIFHKVKDDPSFPKPVSISDDGIRKAFVSDELDAWIDSRIAARNKAVAA